MAFIQYTMQIVMAFLMISMISIMLPRAMVSAGRINEVLETDPKIKDKDKTKEFKEDKKGYVEFKDVSFHYPDADTEVISDITFTAVSYTHLDVYKRQAKGGIPEVIKQFKIESNEEISICDLLVKVGFASSKSEAKRMVIGKGVKVNGETIEDINTIIIKPKEKILQFGKNKFIKII